MEFLLLWWDELDDVVGACRHLATATVDEVVSLAAPLSALTAAGAAWLMATRLAAHAHVVAAAAVLLDPRS